MNQSTPRASRDLRQVNVRLAAETVAELEAIALIDGIPQVEVVREALESLIRARRSDPAFQEKRRLALRRQVQLLERLADS